MKTVLKYHLTVVALVLSASAPNLEAEPFLYVAEAFSGTLAKVDVGAGTKTVIGPFNQPGVDAIAISPGGKLYTVTQGWPPGGPDPRLSLVDVTTGSVTPFGANLSPENFMGIGFTHNGELYGVNAGSGTPDTDSLFRFDPASGVASKVRITGSCGWIMDLACHPDGTLYGIDPTSLYKVNPNTGKATLVVTTGHSRLMGIAIDDKGVFYVTDIVPDAPLLVLDPLTGLTTPVPGITLNGPHGLEIIPTLRNRPVTIAITQSPVATHQWVGSVDTDSNGLPDGTLTFDQNSASIRHVGSSVHFEGSYEIETDFYAFKALLSVVLRSVDGSLRGNGVISEGWLEGTRVHLEAQMDAGGSATGWLRLMPGSAE